VNYLGGKARSSKWLTGLILESTNRREVLVEPFIGGAWMAQALAPHFDKYLGSDIVPDLVLLYNALLDGWNPPHELSREEYESLRKAEPSAMRAFAGFGCSFGGKWFGGYAVNQDHRNYALKAARGLMKKKAALQQTASSISCIDYKDIEIPSSAVIYLDPPYDGTTKYSAVKSWDTPKFYETLEKWCSTDAHVFVSAGQECSLPTFLSLLAVKDQQLSLSQDGNSRRRKEMLYSNL